MFEVLPLLPTIETLVFVIGLSVPIPTRLFVLSIFKVVVSNVTSPVKEGPAKLALRSNADLICAEVEGLALLLSGALNVNVLCFPSNCVWIALVTPETCPNSVEVVVLTATLPLASLTSARIPLNFLYRL